MQLSRQFAQPRLFDPGPRQSQAASPPAQGPSSAATYGSAHDPTEWDMSPGAFPYTPTNRVPSTSDSYFEHINRQSARGNTVVDSGEEYVPTPQVTTLQREINESAVQHQVEHANPLALDANPSVFEYPGYDGETLYDLDDGNHRTNAALARGQLFMPAKVRRFGKNDPPSRQGVVADDIDKLDNFADAYAYFRGE